MKEEKTNVLRILDQKKINYKGYNYKEANVISGVDVANYLGVPFKNAFKTLVTFGKSGKHYVFVIPVDKELDLKKAAASVGEKNVSMLKSKELLPLTGYIHGGCSPIGMKKFFETTFDSSLKDIETVFFSGGRIGSFVSLPVCEIEKVIPYKTADITVKP